MWAMLQAAGAVLAKFGAKHPAVKWAVIALVGLFAVEFVAKEAIDVWVKLETARATVAKTNADARSAEAEAQAKTGVADKIPTTPAEYEQWVRQHQDRQQPVATPSGPVNYQVEIDRATQLLSDRSLSPEARAELLTYRGIYYRLAHEADKAIADLKAAIYLGASWRAVVSLVEAYLYKFSDVGIALCGLVVVVGFGGPWWERRKRRLKAAAARAVFENYTKAREAHLGLGGADTPAHDQEPRP